MSEPDGSAPDSLTGVWNGLFRYAQGGPSTPFTATLIESGLSVTGSTHEPCSVAGCPQRTHVASLSGRRQGAAVSFAKTYEPPGFGYDKVAYDGALNAERTEIAGRWRIGPTLGGDFLMVRAGRRTAAQVRQKLATV